MATDADVLRALEGLDLSTPIADIKVDVPLVAQGLDSMDVATLILAVESIHNKAIPPEQAARLRTVSDIVAFLNS